MVRQIKKAELPKLHEQLPQSMSDMACKISLMLEAEIKNNVSPIELAIKAVIEICELYGGTALYVPRVSALKRKARDDSLFADYRSGMGIKEIIKKYKMSSQAVYDIIRKHRIQTRLQ